MSDYKRGEMDIRSHQDTFKGFLRVSIWAVAAGFGFLILLALINA